jgi:hypothetical protein
VLGLLIASAKDSFDAQRNGVAQLAANAVVLDRFLAFYGPEAQPTRELLRASMVDMLRRTWPEDERAAGQTRAKSWTEGRNDELYVRALTRHRKVVLSALPNSARALYVGCCKLLRVNRRKIASVSAVPRRRAVAYLTIASYC